METKIPSFIFLKNVFYIIYMVISAITLMNDYKIITIILMVILAPLIISLEHYESLKKNN